jgi:hypothetical protein
MKSYIPTLSNMVGKMPEISGDTPNNREDRHEQY